MDNTNNLISFDDIVLCDKFGNKKQVSRIIYGCCIPYLLNALPGGEEKLEQIFNLGINSFDTARVYNKSEAVLGLWLQKYGHREETVIISKGCHPNRNGHRITRTCIIEDLEESLKNLKSDYIDIYMLHRDDPDCNLSEVIGTLNELKMQNKIIRFGASNWTSDRIDEANEYAYAHNLEGFSVSSPQFSVMDQVNDPWGWNCITLTGDDNSYQRDWYRKNHMPVFAWSSLAGGMASGKIKSYNIITCKKKIGNDNYRGYASFNNFKRLKRIETIAGKKNAIVSQIALAWLFHQGLNIYPICTSSDVRRVDEMKKSFDIKLSQSELEWIYAE